MPILNITAILVFAVINIAVFLIHRSDGRVPTLRFFCYVLLIINICRFLYYPFAGISVRVPVEFSSLAYFIVPSIVIFNLDFAECWASYSGLMAGFFFYAAFIFSGENIYGEYPLFVVFLTLICHGILYFCGLVMFLNREFSDCDLIKLYIGNFFVLLWALLMRPFTAPDSRLFIYEFLEGKFIKLILPENYFRFAIPVYYVLIFLFIISSVILFFRINRRFHKSEL